MTINTANSLLNSTACSKSTMNVHASSSKLLKRLPVLRTKNQLCKIIVTKDNKPDHGTINLYWDRLRSWYNPKKTYVKDGKIVHITKLKTKGIFLSYAELADDYSCSQETIRARIAKLENLCLIQRSFQHKETATTKSFNRLIIYVWKDTPYFFNAYGIGQNEVKELIPQTNYKYISKKYNISFGLQNKQNSNFIGEGGIQTHLNTKELTKPFIDIKDRSMKSNFYQNSFKEKKGEESVTKMPNNENQVSKLFNANHIVGVFKQAKRLEDFYPLNREDSERLQASSGRKYSLNSMNEILLDMSKRLKDRFFNSKKAFMNYMSKVFANEMRDPNKIGDDGFRIKNNVTENELNIRKQEEFLTKLEYSLEVSPEWHFKKKLAAVLERSKAYNILQAYTSCKKIGEVFQLRLSKHIELSESDKDIILNQARASHEYQNNETGEIHLVHELEIFMPEKIHKPSNHEALPLLPNNVWGRVRSKLIEIYGIHVDRNWFSKLHTDVEINEESRVIQLQAPSPFIKDWIKEKYFDAIQKVVDNDYKVELR